MEALKLELKSEIKNGRTQVGDIIAYYEQHVITETGETYFLRVAYLKSTTVMVPLSDGTETEELREETMNAMIEYSSNTFHCQILEQAEAPQFWDIYWNIFNQLKPSV